MLKFPLVPPAMTVTSVSAAGRGAGIMLLAHGLLAGGGAPFLLGATSGLGDCLVRAMVSSKRMNYVHDIWFQS
jgi:hypothetical protein